MKKYWLVLVFAVLFLVGCGETSGKSATSQNVHVEKEPTEYPEIPNERMDVVLTRELFKKMEKDATGEEISETIEDIKRIDRNLAVGMAELVDYWHQTEEDDFVQKELKKVYAKDNSLCFVVLGFKLKDDGMPEEELMERLNVSIKALEKYPEARVLVTGGGTALNNKTATEAEVMADYLLKNGISKERIIVEKESKTTMENAIFSVNILKKSYPEIRELVVVTSDYHIGLGCLMFEEKLTLDNYVRDHRELKVVGNIAYMQGKYKGYSRKNCARCVEELYDLNGKQD